MNCSLFGHGDLHLSQHTDVKLVEAMDLYNPSAEAQTDGFLGLATQPHLNERGSRSSMRNPASKIR